MKKTLLFMSVATAVIAGEANRATLTDIKEATVLLIKENKENRQAIEALKTRINMNERAVKEISLEEIKIKENLYLKPSKYDSYISDFLNRYENQSTQPMVQPVVQPVVQPTVQPIMPEQPIVQQPIQQPAEQPFQEVKSAEQPFQEVKSDLMENIQTNNTPIEEKK